MDLRILHISLFIVLNFSLFSQGLQLHYTFDNNAMDMSGNNLNGTVIGALSSVDRGGNPNAAYYFNQGASIEIPNSPLVKPGFPFSVSLWMRDDLVSAQASILYASDETTGKYSGFWISLLIDGRISASYGDGGVPAPENRVSRHSVEAITDNEWHNIVAIFHGEYDIELFIDCRSQEGTYSGSGSGLVDYGNTGAIANRNGLQHFGYIDDVHLYDMALNTFEQDSLCKAGTPSGTLALDIIWEDEPLTIFPNPANESINFDFGKNEAVSEFSVFDQQGRLVLTSQTASIDVSELNKGMYRAVIAFKGQSKSTTFIKQ